MLSDVKRRALKPADSLYCVADAKGLTVEIPTAGALRWRLRYRFAGKAKMLCLGRYPDLKLTDTRDLRDAARALLRRRRSKRGPSREEERIRRRNRR